MYKNLDSEQERKGHSDSVVAEILGLSCVAYQGKKRTGKFLARECKVLCHLYDCSFEYLFRVEE